MSGYFHCQPILALLSAHCSVDLTVLLYYYPAANTITAVQERERGRELWRERLTLSLSDCDCLVVMVSPAHSALLPAQSAHRHRHSPAWSNTAPPPPPALRPVQPAEQHSHLHSILGEKHALVSPQKSTSKIPQRVFSVRNFSAYLSQIGHWRIYQKSKTTHDMFIVKYTAAPAHTCFSFVSLPCPPLLGARQSRYEEEI